MPNSSLKTLSSNLKALMAAHPEFNTQGKVAAQAKLNQTTIGSILRCKNAASITQLDKIAKVFELTPWQLLFPELDPSNPPVKTISKAEIDLYHRLKLITQDMSKTPL